MDKLFGLWIEKIKNYTLDYTKLGADSSIFVINLSS